MKQQKILYTLTLLLALFAFGNAGAVDYVDWSSRMESARKLYYSGSYYAAEKAFEELSQSLEGRNELKQSETEAYKVLCAIALDRVNIDGLVKVFSDKYPNAPELSMVRYALASNYFDRGRYDEADRILTGINERHLYKDWRTEFRFKKAFSALTQGRRAEAAGDFRSIVDRKAAYYTYPSLYYLGYINYLDRNFDEACGFFVKAAADSRFTKMSSYYLLESKFLSGDHYYVVANGDSVYDSVDEDMKPNVARILSESHFSLGDAARARKYMDIYESSATSLSRKDHYYSAQLAYSLESFPRAIQSFSKVVGEDDSLSQSAHYYRANSYLRTGNKLAAMDDFKAASGVFYDTVVTEDAMFNFAKLSFDVNSDITQFEKYLDRYPSGGRADIIHNYMATAFLDRKDYGTAVTLLTRISDPGPEVTSNLQKAAFFRAMQLAEGGSWRSAAPVFELSASNGAGNPAFASLARFWEAECLFRDDCFKEAMAINSELLSDKEFKKSAEYPMALYNQAYCHFKSGDYAAAREWFSKYLSCSDTYFEKDARIRMADAYYMQNDYSAAASAYGYVVDRFPGSDDIYPALQAARSAGLAGNSLRRIDLLREAVKHRNADLYPNALYELGRAYAQQGESENASECFYSLLGVKSDSTFLTKAMLELAMINSNAGKYDKALDYYRQVIKEAPDTEDARNALAGMEIIYNLLDRPGEYLAYLDNSGMSAVKSKTERESMIFASAEQIYRKGNYQQAISALQSYISDYPGGADRTKAYYLLAGALDRTGRKEAASDAYQKVVKAGGEYRGAALGEYARLCYELEKYKEASGAYALLAGISTMDDERCGAFSGKMRSDYKARDYAGAASVADSVLAFSYSSDFVLREARYVKAKSLISIGDREQAMSLFGELASNTSDPFGAESVYMLILNDFNAGDYESVENRVYAFSDAGTSQMEWLARSFIVLGDSFVARGERDQAEATYRSIAEGYRPQGGDDVLNTVQSRLAELSSAR